MSVFIIIDLNILWQRHNIFSENVFLLCRYFGCPGGKRLIYLFISQIRIIFAKMILLNLVPYIKKEHWILHWILN